MYRTHPQMDRLLTRLERGDIGVVQRVESSFGFEASYDPAHRLFDPALGGGAVLDVGGSPVSFALLTSLLGLHMEDRIELLEASLELAPTGVDRHARASFRMGDVEAVLEVSTTRELGRVGRVIGERGSLELEDPFLPGGHRRGRVGRLIHVDEHGRRTEELVESELDCFALEARAFTEHVRDPQRRCPPSMIPIEMSVEIARLCGDWLEVGRNEP
jgi:predicted dehydrogenase